MGGAEKYTWRLAQAFRDKGSSVTILTTGEPFKSSSDVSIITHPLSSKLSFRRVNEYDAFCTRTLKELKADVIFGLDRNRFQTHLRASNGVHAAYLERRKQSEPFWETLSFRLNPLHRTLLSIEKTSFEHPELKMLFTNSAMVKEELLRFYKTDPKKIHVVHNGVEWKEMGKDFEQWPTERNLIAKQLNLPPEAYHFLFIGHNYKRKGLEKLLQGLSLLEGRDFHLSVVGKEKNLSHFQSLAKKLHLENQVRFFGPRSDIRSFYQLADCLVIPSFYDPFANVTVEALAMGVFVVSSKANGGHEILTEGSGECIENLFDPASVAEALKVALAHPKTEQSAHRIRAGVAHLDFANQLRYFEESVSPQ